MEVDVTDTGLAGNGVGEGNMGNSVAYCKVDVGSGIVNIATGDSVAAGTFDAGGASLRTFKSDITMS